LIPFAGGIIIIILCALDSSPGDNRYGPSPKPGIGGPGGYGNPAMYGQQPYGQQPYGEPPYPSQPYGNEPPYPPQP
jgi:hypothetical protein